MKDISRYENMHILLWLFKDICWLMELKIFGIIMIVPTVLMAIYIAIKTRSETVYYINLAILCWIAANSYWMICELTDNLHRKDYTIVGFVLGLIMTGIYYWKEGIKKKNYPIKSPELDYDNGVSK